jgi:tRNA nucleotidyltransferase (CCA-adding enzyme)
MTTVMIPAPVGEILKTLEAAGYGAWCVGGCVRDALLDRMPGDWDVTTSARPEETMALFAGRAVPTGLRHGTVTVKTEQGGVEITTLRRDGAYRDHRRPETVTFTDSLEEDLRRRDFTINAMAADLQGTLYDPLGGRADLTTKVLRCVGEPDRRFGEDALRILRGLRFGAGGHCPSGYSGGHPPEPGIAESHCSGADLGGAEKAGVRKMGRRGPAGLSGCGWRLLAGDSAHGGV